MEYKSVRKTIFSVILLIVVITITFPIFNALTTSSTTLPKYSDLFGFKKTISTDNSNDKYSTDAQPTITVTLTPTPRPLTFAEMNALYGPCATVPVVMYHHIQDSEIAKKKGQQSLSTDPAYLKLHLKYLADHSYRIIRMQDLIDFFNSGKTLPAKPILLTFDDGYEDFYSNAFPLLREFNAYATLFLPTGLVENPDYLKWVQINELASSGLVTIANHTWSHHSTAVDKDVVVKEISTADTQLAERGLNSVKVFAYPYGADSSLAENYLKTLNYNLAFTTHSGNILCKQKKLSLPRIRLGNAPLSQFGF